jgi:hypothetical protein
MNAAKLVVPAGAALLLLTFALQEARGGHFVVLKEGTPVVVKLTEDFDAADLKEGGKVPMAVAEKVTKEGFILIDAGAPVEATFTPGKRKIKDDSLVSISSVQAVDGQDVMLRLTPEAPEKVKADDAGGQLPMVIPEEGRRMPEGTTFRVYLSESYFIEE